MYIGYDDAKYVVTNPNCYGKFGVVDWFREKPTNLQRKYPKSKGYSLEEIKDNERGREIKLEIEDIIISTN